MSELTPEQSEAIERLRKYHENVFDPEGPYAVVGRYSYSPYSLVQDEATVARMYLAEHPADDAEPVTEEWLRSVMDADSPFLTECRGLAFGVSWYVNKWLCYVRQDDEHVELGQVKTRGDVRRLCTALGIPLKETTP